MDNKKPFMKPIKSIFTFTLECEFQGKITQSITVKRSELENALKEFISLNLN